VKQEEVTGKKVEEAKGTIKSYIRRFMVDGLPMFCLAASVYDTKPVHLISTMHTVCHAVDVVRQYWRPEAGKKVAVVTKRLNIAYDYNFGMGILRGSYRPDA